MKKIILFTILVIVLGGIFFWTEILDFYSRLTLKLPQQWTKERIAPVEEIKKQITAPPPLKAEKESPESLLTQEGIIRVSAIVNPTAVGFNVMADIFVEIESGYVRGVARAMAAHEWVSYAAVSTGDKDLSIQVCAPSTEDLYRFVAEIVADMPGVRKTSTILLPETLKDVYDWHIPDSGGGGKEGRR